MKNLLRKNMEVLLETDSVLVINKPAGIIVHSDGKSDKPTIAGWVLEHDPNVAGVGEPMTIEGKIIDRPGIVHRLDEETSGVLVIAKTQDSFLELKAQFQDRSVEKQYEAFVWGHFKEPTGSIDASIGRNKNDFRRWHAGRGIRGEEREAITQWFVKKQFIEEGEQFSLVTLLPKTGRTHQLRVHLKYIQRPIVGDKLYAPTKPYRLGFERVALHAKSIRFRLGNQEFLVTAPYPKDFAAAIAKYVKP